MMIDASGNYSSPVRSPRRSRTSSRRNQPTTHIMSSRRTSTPRILPAGKAIPSHEPRRRSHRRNHQSDPIQKETRNPGPGRFPIRIACAQVHHHQQSTRRNLAVRNHPEKHCQGTQTHPFHTGPMLPPGTNSAGYLMLLRSSLPWRTASIQRSTRRTMCVLSQRMWAMAG